MANEMDRASGTAPDYDPNEIAPASPFWMPWDFEAGLCKEADLGKRKPPLVEARRLAQRATPKAIKALVEILDQGEDLGAKAKAANSLLDRGWGRAEQSLNVAGRISHTFATPKWMNVASRFAYKLDMPLAEDIIESHPITPEAREYMEAQRTVQMARRDALARGETFPHVSFSDEDAEPPALPPPDSDTQDYPR